MLPALSLGILGCLSEGNVIAAIVVLFHPAQEMTERLLSSLADQVDIVFAIDNTPGSSLSNPPFLQGFGKPVSYVPLGENRGIAEAQNIGIELSIKDGYSHVLLLDQDSAPCPGMVERLLASEEGLLLRGERIAAMSPQILDGRTGKFPCATRYRWFQAQHTFRDTNSAEPVRTDNFIASGSLIRTSILQAVGMMRSDLFIEHVDTEWAFRANSAGYRSYCVPNALMMHCFGDAAATICGKKVYLYSNVRYYYKVRNEVYLARLKTMGRHWRTYILPRIPYHFVLYCMLSKNRISAFCILVKSIFDGLLGRLGPFNHASMSFSRNIIEKGARESSAHTGTGSSRKPRLLYIMTVGMFGGLRDFLVYLGATGFDVSFIASPGPEMELAREEGVAVYNVPIKRDISPLHDLVSLWRLWRLLRNIRPDITNVGTPKAGLLGGLAAVFASVRYRVYTMHGLRLETSRGWERKLLWYTEWLSCRCAHQVYCVSPSLRERAIELKLVDSAKSSVVANGTFNGIEIEHYSPNLIRKDRAEQLRRELGIYSRALVIGYVGRMTRDKGIAELYQAFLLLCAQFTNLRLLLVGEYEIGDPIPNALRARIDADPRVVRTGWISDPAAYYQVIDVLALPTRREGFGLVSIEAQASGVPVVSTKATGTRDSLVDGVTGFSTPVGDAPALAEALALLLGDARLRKGMGESGRDWVARMFDRRIVWAEHKKRYMDVIHAQSSKRKLQDRTVA